MLRKIALVAAAATITTAGLASAADLPSKKSVPALVADEPSAVHGFLDFNYENGMASGGGVPLYKSGVSLFETTAGLSVDLYSNKTGPINSFSAFVGGWAQSWNDAPVGTDHMQEYDWWAGGTVGFADYYKLTVQDLQFQIPNVNGHIKVVENATVTLSYDDAHLGLPIALNPYINIFYTYGGLSSMNLGKIDTYRVDLGIAPSYSFKKSAGVPLTLTVPTQISLGPKDFYYKSGSAGCGSDGLSVCSTGTFQFVTTGLQAKYDLGQIIPKKFGAWSLKAGVKYYHIMNDGIIANQKVIPFSAAKTNYTVLSTGLHVDF